MRFILLSIVLALSVASCASEADRQPGDDFTRRQLSLLKTLPTPSAVSPQTWVELKTGLMSMLEQQLAAGKKSSAAPTSGASRAILSFDSGSGKLSWGYYSAGDYNQDGEVNISDLTPLAVHFAKVGPFDPDTALSVVDGDGNSEINSSDLTPIGANLGVRVAAYNIYTSSEASDFPAGNAAPSMIEPIGSVTFASSMGTPSIDRRQFTFTVENPVADAYYWVRPTDGMAEGTPSTLIGPPVTRAVVIETGDVPTDLFSAAVIEGRPAVAYFDSPAVGNGRLRYRRAIDAFGSQWGAPVTIDAETANTGFGPVLREIAGRPAAIYADLTSGLLRYARADNSVGTGWFDGEYSVVDTGSGFGDEPGLGLMADRPATAYILGAELRFRRADDALGASWTLSSDALAALGGAASAICMALVNGHPAIAISTGGSGGKLLYLRAGAADGGSWPATPLNIAPALTGANFAALAVVAGNPAIIFSSPAGIQYVRSTDTDGGAWAEPLLLEAGSVTQSALAVVDGRPAVAYTLSSALKYIAANDAAGTGWGTPQLLDDFGKNPQLLVLADGSPGILYFDLAFRELKWLTDF